MSLSLSLSLIAPTGWCIWPTYCAPLCPCHSFIIFNLLTLTLSLSLIAPTGWCIWPTRARWWRLVRRARNKSEAATAGGWPPSFNIPRSVNTLTDWRPYLLIIELTDPLHSLIDWLTYWLVDWLSTVAVVTPIGSTCWGAASARWTGPNYSPHRDRQTTIPGLFRVTILGLYRVKWCQRDELAKQMSISVSWYLQFRSIDGRTDMQTNRPETFANEIVHNIFCGASLPGIFHLLRRDTDRNRENGGLCCQAV